MATPSAKLAGSLDALRTLQDRGVVAVRSADLARTHRERLVRHGFLQPTVFFRHEVASLVETAICTATLAAVCGRFRP